MDQIGFVGRLAYLRWMRSSGRVPVVTDKELAEWLGGGVKWLGKWKTKREAPNGLTEAKAIDAALKKLGSSSEWLYEGVGDPPQPKLWKSWLEEYRINRGSPAVAALAKDKAKLTDRAPRTARKRREG